MDTRRNRALENPYYDRWKLASPDYLDDPPQFRCDECGVWAEECECDGGPIEPEPYTREMYEEDRADDDYEEGHNLRHGRYDDVE